MCGIGGYIKVKGVIDLEDVNKIKNMCEEMESRGKDAHGFIIVDTEGKVERLFKLPVKATTLWDELYDVFADWMIGRKAVLFHTRATTSGTEKMNKNNHPFRISKWYLAHNGSAGRRYYYGGTKYAYNRSNYGYSQYYGYDYDYGYGYSRKETYKSDEPVTDSYQYLFKPLVEKMEKGIKMEEAIPKIWDEYGVHGSIWLYNEEQKMVYLYKGENPVSYEVNKDVIRFMSTGLKNELGSCELWKIRLDGSIEKVILCSGKREVKNKKSKIVVRRDAKTTRRTDTVNWKYIRSVFHSLGLMDKRSVIERPMSTKDLADYINIAIDFYGFENAASWLRYPMRVVLDRMGIEVGKREKIEDVYYKWVYLMQDFDERR